jgi:hypothetical protein
MMKVKKEKREIEEVGDEKMEMIGRRYYAPLCVRLLRVEKEELIVGWADGLNAGGLIGTECCGLFVLDEKRRGVVLDEVKEGLCALSSPSQKIKAVERILEMPVLQLVEWMRASGRMRYNPFEEYRVNRYMHLKMREKDKRIRSQFPSNSLLTKWERLIVARLYLGPAEARKFFTPAIYQMLCLYWGHIAHYNREGFFSAQIADSGDFEANLKLWAEGRSTYGYPVDPEKVPLIDELKTIAQAYV